LLVRLRVDVAEWEPVTSADHAGAGRLPSQAELGPEGIAVAIEIDRGKVIHFVWCGYGGVAQTVVDLTSKSGRALQASPAKYCCSNRRKPRCPSPIAAECPFKELRNGIATEVGAEVVIAALAGCLQAIVLQTVDFAARGEQVIAKLTAIERKVSSASRDPSPALNP
jgi:hypothetical protein